MTDLLIMLHQYNEILIGRRKNYSDIFSDEEEKNRSALEFLKLAAKVYLGCESYGAAKATITPQLAERMKLSKIIAMVKIPSFVREKEDRWDYVLAKAFTPSFNEEEWTSEFYYNKACEIRDGKKSTLPKGYFSPSSGKERLAFLIGLILKKEKPGLTRESGYRYAATDDFMEKIIRAYGLEDRYSRFFRSPVDVWHTLLPEEERSEALLVREKALLKAGIKG